MDELVFAGKKYISSKRAGKLTGYTTDYVGQLCRGDKIDCRLVGRNWYINEEAIKAQKKSFKAAQLEEGEKAIDYKKLELEPMYYSNDERNTNPEINKVVIKKVEEEQEKEKVVDLSSEALAKDEETAIEIKEKKENLIPILSMIESPLVDLRSPKKEVVKGPVREVIKREHLLPQKSPVRLPMMKIIASVIVIIGLLFVAGTFTLEDTIHYTSNDTIDTSLQMAGVKDFISF